MGKQQMLTAGDLPTLNANRYPDKTAVVYKDKRFSYRELNDRVNRLANALMGLGIRKGDRVGILFFNSNDAIESFFATQKIGAVAVPLNFRINAREIKWCLDNAKCKAFIYAETFSPLVDQVSSDLATVELLVCSGQSPKAREHDYEQLIGTAPADEPQVEVRPDDWARFMFTGGTTGPSKIAIHTHSSIISTLQIVMTAFNISSCEEVYLNHPPVFHIGGATQVLCVLAAGGTVVLVDVMDPVEILRLIERENATYMFLIPPQMYSNLTQVPNISDYNLNSVRRICAAAGFSSVQLMSNVFDCFPNLDRIYSGYGATELGPACGVEITRDLITSNPAKVSTLGREYPFIEVRLVDDHGQDVPCEVPGEAIFRAPTNFVGYFDNPEATAATIKDGWVYMGDIFIKDAEGLYRFVDRKKDMIKSGGENVFCQEVEAVIYSHPSVAECCVIGLPDPKFGEAVTAIIRTKPGAAPVTAEEIIHLCKERLSSYKKPQKVVFMDDIPKSGIGKIQKSFLREMLSKLQFCAR